MASSSSVSFKFAKAVKPKISSNQVLPNDQQDLNELDVNRFNNSKRQKTSLFSELGSSTTERASKSEKLVVPALGNCLRYGYGKNNDLRNLAKDALLKDAYDFKHPDGKGDQPSSDSQPYLTISGTTKRDFPAESSADADYDIIPPDKYGAAILRGLGWNEGDCIGRNDKKITRPMFTEPRPKGLGLGTKMASHSLKEVSRSSKDAGGADISFKKGCYVQILKAMPPNDVGMVVSVNNDDARIYVKLPSDEIVNLSQYSVQLITKERYKELKDRKPAKIDTIANIQIAKSSHSVPHVEKLRSSWLLSDIRVRLIDKTIYGGKFYQEKINVMDITTPEVCNCITDAGKLLENIHFSKLETVVPRIEGNTIFVKLLTGPLRGQVACLVERDSKRCRAVVRLISGTKEGEIFKVSFDDISHFVGDIEQV